MRGAILILVILGCAGPRQNVGPEPVEASGFSLILNNRHLLDVNVFLQHDGQPDRIATVPSSTSRAIVLPLRMLGQSKTIRLIVELNIESLLARSNYNIQ